MCGLAAKLNVNGFGDDPENLAASEGVGREQPESGLERALVRLDVTAIKLAPIAADMPHEKLAGRVASLGQGVHSAAFLVPGALGALEGGFVLFGALLGVPADIALAISLAKRVRELALGLPGLIVWQWVEGRYLMRRDLGDSR